MKKFGKSKSSTGENTPSKKSDKVQALKQPLADKAIDLIRTGNIEALTCMCAEGSSELKFIHKFHSKSGKTALSVACEEGQLDMVEVLLQAMAIVDLEDQYGMTPVLYAAQAGHIDIVKLLYSVKSEVVTKKNLKGDNAVILAAKNNHLEIVQLLHVFFVPLDEKNAQEETALSIALKLQLFAIAELLCSHGADINVVGINGSTSLMRSAFDGRYQTAEFIVNHDSCSLDVRNLNGETAVMIAARHNNRDVLELLIRRGAQLAVQDHSNRNALMVACMTEKYDLIDLLMDPRAILGKSVPVMPLIDVNEKDVWGNAALMYVCCQGDKRRRVEHCNAAEKLVSRYGAAIDNMDRVFNTALMHCCMKGNLDMALLLLRLGASPHHRNIDGIAMRDLWTNENDRSSFDDAVVTYSSDTTGPYSSAGVIEKPEWINHLNGLRELRKASEAVNEQRLL